MTTDCHSNEYRAAKALLGYDIDRVGGVNAFSVQTRVGAPRVSNYKSLATEHLNTHAPLDVLIDLFMVLRKHGITPQVLKHLADVAGFDLVPKAAGEQAAEARARQLVSFITAGADLSVAIAEADADGVREYHESKRVVECARAVREVSACIEEDARRALGEPVLRMASRSAAE